MVRAGSSLIAVAALLARKVVVARERKGRGGKTVTLARGLALDAAGLAALGKRLRSACGAGGAVLLMAGAFPASTFAGYDISRYALGRAEEKLEAAGVTNASFHDPRTDPICANGPEMPRSHATTPGIPVWKSCSMLVAPLCAICDAVRTETALASERSGDPAAGVPITRTRSITCGRSDCRV